MMKKKSKKILNQLISFFLIGFLSLTAIPSPALSDSSAVPFPLPADQKFDKAEIFKLGLPESIGKIKKIHQGTRPEFIIHIQDAHANEEAQRNISKILNYLHQRAGLSDIFVEGASGDLFTELFTFFPDKKSKRLVSDYFLKQGRLSGAEYYLMMENPKAGLYGIEDSGLYQANRSFYLKALDHQETDLKILGHVEGIIKKAGRFVFLDEVRELQRMREAFLDESSNLVVYSQYLAQKAASQSLDVKPYPKLLALLEIANLEKEIEAKKSKKEDASAAMERYRGLYDLIDAGIFNEIERLGQSIKQPLLMTQEAVNLDRLVHVVSILKKMFAFTLGEYEVKDFYDHREDYKTLQIRKVLLPLLEKYHFQEGLPAELSKLDGHLADVEAFYETALKRDQILIQNAETRILSDKKFLSAIITGGFHTPGIEKYLREKGYSYAVITPKIGGSKSRNKEASLYESAMKGRPIPLRKMLKEIYRPAKISDSRLQLSAELAMNIGREEPAEVLEERPASAAFWDALAAGVNGKPNLDNFSPETQVYLNKRYEAIRNEREVESFHAKSEVRTSVSRRDFLKGAGLLGVLSLTNVLAGVEIPQPLREDLTQKYRDGALTLKDLQSLPAEERIRILSQVLPLDRVTDLFHSDERSKKLKQPIPSKEPQALHYGAEEYPMSAEMLAYVTDYMKAHGLPTDDPKSLYPRDFYYKVLRPITIAQGGNADPMAKITYDPKYLSNDVKDWVEFKKQYASYDLEKLTSSFLRLGFDDYLTRAEWEGLDASWRYRAETGVPFKVYLAYMILKNGRNFITNYYEDPQITYNKRIRGIIGPYTRESVAERFILRTKPYKDAKELVENGLGDAYQNWLRNYIDGGVPHLFPEALYVGGEQKNERVANTINQVAEVWRRHFGIYGISFPIAGYHENSDERREFVDALDAGLGVRYTASFNNDILYTDQKATPEKYLGKSTDEQIALRIIQFVLQHPVLWRKGAKNLDEVLDLKLIEEIVLHMKAHYQIRSVIELRRQDLGNWLIDDVMGKFLNAKRLLVVNPNYPNTGAVVGVSNFEVWQPTFIDDGGKALERTLDEVQGRYDQLPYDYRMLLWAPALRLKNFYEKKPYDPPTIEGVIAMKKEKLARREEALAKAGGGVVDYDLPYVDRMREIRYANFFSERERYDAEQANYRAWKANKAKYKNYDERLKVQRDIEWLRTELKMLLDDYKELQRLQVYEKRYADEQKQLHAELKIYHDKERKSNDLYALSFDEQKRKEWVRNRLDKIYEYQRKLDKLRHGNVSDKEIAFEQRLRTQWDRHQRELEFYAWVGEMLKDGFTNWHLSEYLTARKLGWDTAKSLKLAKMKVALRPAIQHLYGRKLKVEGDFYYVDPGILGAIAEEAVERGLDPDQDAVLIEALFVIAHYKKVWKSKDRPTGQYGVVEYEALTIYNQLVGEGNQIRVFNLQNPEHYSFLIWWTLNRTASDDAKRWMEVIKKHSMKAIAEMAGQKREAFFGALNPHLPESERLAAREIPNDYSMMTPAERGEVMGFMEEAMVDWEKAQDMHGLAIILLNDYAKHPERFLEALKKATQFNEALRGRGWDYSSAKGGLTARALADDPKAKAYFFDYLTEFAIKNSPAMKNRSEVRKQSFIAAANSAQDFRFEIEKAEILKLIGEGRKAAKERNLTLEALLARNINDAAVLETLGLKPVTSAIAADQRGIFVAFDPKIHDKNYFTQLLNNRPDYRIPITVFAEKSAQAKQQIEAYGLPSGNIQISDLDLQGYLKDRKIVETSVLQIVRDKNGAGLKDYNAVALQLEVQAVKLSEYVVLGLSKPLEGYRYAFLSTILRSIVEKAKSEARIAQSA